MADPDSLTHSSSITYQGFVMGLWLEAWGDTLAFMSICALLHLAWGTTHTHLGASKVLLREILYSVIPVERIRHCQCMHPLWVQKQCLVLQIKLRSTAQMDFLSSFFQAFNYFCIELMWNYMSLDNVNNAWDLRQTHERSLFFMSNNSLFFMVQIKSDRSEAVKKYTKCSFTDHTDIALD